MSDDPTHWVGFVRIPPQGGMQDDKEATSTREGWHVDIPPVEDAMAEACLQEVETYVSCGQNTVVQFIATRTIMDLCMAAERIPGY